MPTILSKQTYYFLSPGFIKMANYVEKYLNTLFFNQVGGHEWKFQRFCSVSLRFNNTNVQYDIDVIT